MLGGDNIFIAGPCYEPSDLIVCEFPGGKLVNGSYINSIQASCTVPMLDVTGRLLITMSVNGGKSFDFEGILTSVNINRLTPRVVRLIPETWIENFPVKISWDPGLLGDDTLTVAILLARFSMKDDDVYFHSTFLLKAKQKNIGESQFTVPKGEGQGVAVGDGHFVTLVQVKKISGNSNNSPSEWIWSDLFYWLNYGLAEQRCMFWYKKQPNPKIFTDDASLLPCPQTFLQAMADRGRFTTDEYCNPRTENHCVVYHFGANHCFRTNIASAQGAGQQCCYTEPGNLMAGLPNGGSLDRFHIEAGVPALSHFFQDLVPYLDCCLLSDNCERYFDKRPSDDGSRYEPPRPATGNGDPHMITLDGVKYSFNGYGEYHVLQIAPTDFELQGRMQPLIKDDGNSARATVFKAFAMKENASDVVQVHINGRQEMEILVNSDLVEFDEQFMLDFHGVTIIKYNNTSKYSTIFHSGISVTIERVEDLLQFMLLVPPLFKGNTSGLLGFWDGDQQNDYLLPNGTILNYDSSQSRIHHEFGQLWMTTPNESLFSYEEGKNHSSYFNMEFVPLFLDQGDLMFENATLGQQAHEVCGDNIQCLFDIHTTGRVSIGVATKQAVELFAAVINGTETPGCIPLENTIRNGTLQRNETDNGEIIYRFHCNSGFFLNGSSVISCVRAQWNGSSPSCLPDCIPIEDTFRDGTVRKNYMQDGEVVYQFDCNPGFSLKGSSVLSCLHGELYGSKPRCHETDEGTPWYVIVAPIVGGAVIIFTAIIGIIYFAKARHNQRNADPGENSMRGVTFSNPAYA